MSHSGTFVYMGREKRDMEWLKPEPRYEIPAPFDVVARNMVISEEMARGEVLLWTPRASVLIRDLADPADACPTCGRVLRIGDWPFGCKGDPEKHR